MVALVGSGFVVLVFILGWVICCAFGYSLGPELVSLGVLVLIFEEWIFVAAAGAVAMIWVKWVGLVCSQSMMDHESFWLMISCFILLSAVVYLDCILGSDEVLNITQHSMSNGVPFLYLGRAFLIAGLVVCVDMC